MAGRAAALALLLVLGAPSPGAARHGGGVLLDARRASPGIQIELVEIPASQASTPVRYRLHATGIPRDVTFNVWTKEFGAAFQQILTGFRLDETGVLVGPDGSGRRQQLDRVTLEPGPYPLGAAWEVGLVSDDRTVAAFARAIPRPIAAQVGGCAVSLELVSRRGDRFIASGSGFAPGDEVTVEAQDSGRVVQKRQRVGADGWLPPDVISHRADDSNHQVRYVVRGRGCEVVVGYRWGEQALIRR
jgi:hypothetical protein